MQASHNEGWTIARGSIPLHFQIERLIRARIQSGDYPPGAALPSEAQLCQEFQVSRSTLRQALGSLQRERLITRHSGKGTFVAARAAGDSFAGFLGSIEDIFAYARETEYQLLTSARVEPPPEVTAMLKIPPGSKVMEYHGLRRRGGPPFVYVTTWLPLNIGQQIDPADIRSGPIVLLISELVGIRIAEVQQWMTVTLASREVARALKVPLRSPMLLVKRLYLSSEGVPVDFTVNYFRPDLFELHQRFVAY